MAYLPCSLRAAMLLFTENVLFPKGFKQLLSPVLLAMVLLVGCRGGGVEDEETTSEAEPTPQITLSPTPTTTAAPDVAATPTAAPQPAPKPTTEATEVPKAPSTAEAQLPNALLKTWEPVSNVLYEFGPMTITSDQVQWGKGQSSSYTVVSRDGGSYLLKLEAAPSFYDTPHPYIKLIPEMNAAGEMTGDMEVAFYENEAAAQQDQYIMYGSYF